MRCAARAGATLALLCGSLGCEGPDLGVPWDFERMLEQPRYDAYEAAALFEDGAAMRVPPPGTVPHEPPFAGDPETGDALPANEEEAGPIPVAVSRALVERGGERFAVFCSPCHGTDGTARTPVARSMPLRPPPSLHEPAIRARGLHHVHRVIEYGYGLMPSYADLLSPQERWAVALFVEALQLQRDVPLDALPADVRARADAALEDAP